MALESEKRDVTTAAFSAYESPLIKRHPIVVADFRDLVGKNLLVLVLTIEKQRKIEFADDVAWSDVR